MPLSRVSAPPLYRADARGNASSMEAACLAAENAAKDVEKHLAEMDKLYPLKPKRKKR